MGRKNLSELRRKEILEAFSRALAKHGYEGATMAVVAGIAGISPGLLHHHFRDKQEILLELIHSLEASFTERLKARPEGDALNAYLEATLKLDEHADIRSAKCWVGIFSEAIRNPAIFTAAQASLEAQLDQIKGAAKDRLRERDAYALLANVVGALVLGAFAPQKAAGFALPGAKKLANALC